MNRILLAALVLVVSAQTVSAQAITHWNLRIYKAGDTTTISTTSLQVAQVTCNQPPIVPGPTDDPNEVWFNDPVNAGRACLWRDTGAGPLLALPFGSYEATLSAVNSVGQSAESTRVPFTRKGQTPGVPTGVGLRRV